MDADAKKLADFCLDILPAQTKKALDFLSGQSWIGDSGWYLAGGTALALYAGHRRSVDLDFFTLHFDFDNLSLLNHFFENKDWRIEINKKNTIYGELFKAKINFIAYPFFIPKQDFFQYGFVKILHPVDVAVMKIVTISQRGKKKDFFDLYWCAKNLESLEKLIQKLKQQYPSVAHDYHHILKSMVYFNDAENDPEPEIYFNASWRDVKDFFKKEIPVIAKKIIKL